MKCPLHQVNPISFDRIVGSSHHLFIFAVAPFPSVFLDFSALSAFRSEYFG